MSLLETCPETQGEGMGCTWQYCNIIHIYKISIIWNNHRKALQRLRFPSYIFQALVPMSPNFGTTVATPWSPRTTASQRRRPTSQVPEHMRWSFVLLLNLKIIIYKWDQALLNPIFIFIQDSLALDHSRQKVVIIWKNTVCLQCTSHPPSHVYSFYSA